MSYSLPKYYFRDIPEYVMEEIINEMIEGKTEPTLEEMEEWHTSDLERQAEALLAQTCYRTRERDNVPLSFFLLGVPTGQPP